MRRPSSIPSICLQWRATYLERNFSALTPIYIPVQLGEGGEPYVRSNGEVVVIKVSYDAGVYESIGSIVNTPALLGILLIGKRHLKVSFKSGRA